MKHAAKKIMIAVVLCLTAQAVMVQNPHLSVPTK